MKKMMMNLIAPQPELARAIIAAPATRGVASAALFTAPQPRAARRISLAEVATGTIRVVTENLRVPATV